MHLVRELSRRRQRRLRHGRRRSRRSRWSTRSTARCASGSSRPPGCARSRRSCWRSDAVSEYGPASRIVIVGGSIAGLTAARELRAAGFRGALTVVDRDPQAPYRRPEVSKKLLVERLRGRTRLTWPAELQAELVQAEVDALDLPRRTITLAGQPADGRRPVRRTGDRQRRPHAGNRPSRPATPAAQRGSDASVHWLRSAADAARLRRGTGPAAAVSAWSAAGSSGWRWPRSRSRSASRRSWSRRPRCRCWPCSAPSRRPPCSGCSRRAGSRSGWA